jgi:hypothetical protein
VRKGAGRWGGGVGSDSDEEEAHLSDRMRRPRGSPSPPGSEHDLDLVGRRKVSLRLCDG